VIISQKLLVPQRFLMLHGSLIVFFSKNSKHFDLDRCAFNKRYRVILTGCVDHKWGCFAWSGVPNPIACPSHQLKRGTYATTSTYTPDAQQFAKDNGINALDGAGLLALIAKRMPNQQQELLAVAYEGEYWRPTCASCGVKLVERTPAKGGANFWGCSNYPKCKSRLPMVVALR
jgi:hypothetical protein